VTQPTAYIHHEVYEGRGFSRLHDSWRRYALARQVLDELGFFAGPLRQYRQEAASDEDLVLVHDHAYLEFVKSKDAEGSGFLDYGDTPAYTGVLRRARLAVGGTILACQLVASGEVSHAFNPGGGLHHAHRDRAGGFCVFNDVAVAVRRLQRESGLQRLAIVDCDGHHGDGTEAAFLEEPVLTISLHRFGGRFYPRTGAAAEFGSSSGHGYNLNVPLPRGVGDDAYMYALEQAVLPRLYAYRPQVLVVQVGADGHHGDSLVRLGLSLRAYSILGERLHQAAHDLCDGRLVLVAGGGYKPEAVARCWAAFLASVVALPVAALPSLGEWLSTDTPPSSTGEAMAAVHETVAWLRDAGALREPR
jgi:acetoin utilization protein AcuC